MLLILHCLVLLVPSGLGLHGFLVVLSRSTVLAVALALALDDRATDFFGGGSALFFGFGVAGT